MVVQPSLHERKTRFLRLKTRLHCLKADIYFLRQCKINGVFPNFVKVKCAVRNSRTDRVVHKSKLEWLRRETKHLYGKLSCVELEAYESHLALTKLLLHHELTTFMDDCTERIESKIPNKKRKLKGKLHSLVNKKNQSKEERRLLFDVNEMEKDKKKFVRNLSTKSFDQNTLDTLSKGLNYTPTPKHIPIDEVIAEIESGIKYMPEHIKQDIRREITPVLKNAPVSGTKYKYNKSFDQVLKRLKESDCVYMKSDKGRDLVILDRTDYVNRMQEVISADNFLEMKKTPLPSMKKGMAVILKSIENVFGKTTKWKLMVSNPCVPKLYGLPKTHKPIMKMRPIVSNIGSPTEKIAKWLVSEFKQYIQPAGFSLNNTVDFIDKVKNTKIGTEEIMISFDVESLFPSIPINTTMEYLEEWLKEREPNEEKRNVYMQSSRFCMKSNYCQLNEKYYKIIEGTCMGNALSPFLANLFMSKFESTLHTEGRLPRVWWGYVDDVFAVIKRSDKENILNVLNSRFPTIKFTCEVESESGKLPFLDVLVTKKEEGLHFGVYRKPTNIPRYIPAESFCPNSHKEAAFNSMVHRMCQLPLDAREFMVELRYIKYAAILNGYDEEMIDKLVRKHSNKRKRMNLSTLFSQNPREGTRRLKVQFAPTVTNHLKSVFKKYNIELVYSTKKLKNYLGSIKDKTPTVEKSGIYKFHVMSVIRFILGRLEEALKLDSRNI